MIKIDTSWKKINIEYFDKENPESFYTPRFYEFDHFLCLSPVGVTHRCLDCNQYLFNPWAHAEYNGHIAAHRLSEEEKIKYIKKHLPDFDL